MSEHKRKHVVNATSTGVVVGTGAAKKHPWQFAGVLLAVVLLAALVGGGARWWQQYEHNKHAAMDRVQTKTQDALDLAVNGNYDQATKIVQDELKNPKLTPDQKYQLYFQQGITEENAQHYSAAVENYKKADAINPTQGSAEAMARALGEAGNKTAAIQEYKTARSRIPANYPLKTDTVQKYNNAITALGGTP